MNWLVYHVASGHAFFTGVVLLVLAVAGQRSGKKALQRFQLLFTVLGLIAIAVSATPLPYWFYGLVFAIVIGWLIISTRKHATERVRRISEVSVMAILAIAAGWEIPFHLTPHVSADTSMPVVIYGDSITAGIGENEAETWPAVLARTTLWKIHDHSRMGATAATVVRKIQENPVPRGLVILEIGGNDVLGNTSLSQFESQLDEVLNLLAARHEVIVMFELPLPPFFNEYGRIQRKLARRYGVAMIPKRVLMGVLAGDEATLDSIHLTQRGHDEMAAIVKRMLD